MFLLVPQRLLEAEALAETEICQVKLKRTSALWASPDRCTCIQRHEPRGRDRCYQVNGSQGRQYREPRRSGRRPGSSTDEGRCSGRQGDLTSRLVFIDSAVLPSRVSRPNPISIVLSCDSTCRSKLLNASESRRNVTCFFFWGGGEGGNGNGPDQS